METTSGHYISLMFQKGENIMFDDTPSNKSIPIISEVTYSNRKKFTQAGTLFFYNIVDKYVCPGLDEEIDPYL